MANKSMNIALTLSAVDKMTHVIKSSVNKGIAQLSRFQKKADSIANASAGFAQQAGAMGVAAGAAIAIPVKAAVDFEAAMLGVAKQVKGARDENGKLTKTYRDMEKSILSLSTKIPMTAAEISAMVAAGARMNIPTKNLLEFTKVAAKAATAFDLDAGALAEDLGKISVIYKRPIESIEGLADAINFLDDNAIAKGGDIIEVMKRIGGQAEQIGFKAENAAVLASTLLTLGSTAEVAGTAANALMRELSIATMQPKRFQEGLQAIGMTAKDVQSAMSKDAQGTILKVLDALNKVPKELQSTVTTQLFGKEYQDDVAKLAQGMTEYRRQLSLLDDKKLKGSMGREFAARLATSQAQMEMFNNTVNKLAVTIGAALLPSLNKIMSRVAPIIESFAVFAENNKGLVSTIGLLTAGFAAVMIPLSGLGFMISGVATLFSTLSALAPILLGGISALTTGFSAFTAVIIANPIGATIAAIAVAAMLIYKYWTPITEFFTGIWNDISAAFDRGFLQGVWEILKNINPVYWVSKAFNAVSEYLFGVDLFDAGESIMDGLFKGLGSKYNEVVGSISEFASDISKSFKSVLGIASPSKVFMEYGMNIAQGTEQGMVKGGLGAGMGAGAAMALSPISNTTSNSSISGGAISINYSPNITIGAGATEASKREFMDILKQNKRELMDMLSDAQGRENRLRY